MNRIRAFVAFLAVVLSFALSLWLLNFFLLAYVNGGSATLFIDKFDEQHVEYYVFMGVYAVITLGIYYTLEKLLSVMVNG